MIETYFRKPPVLSNVDTDTLYLTACRDYNFHSGYEFIVGAYEIEATDFSLSGEPFPVTLERRGGFRTKAAATRAGQKWADEWLARFA